MLPRRTTNCTPTRCSRNLRLCILLAMYCLLFGSVEAKRKQEADVAAAEDDIPGVPWLIEYLGKEIYSVIKAPKYKFYIYMTIGKLPDERSTVVLLSTVCNLLYGILILVGFLLAPRVLMLVLTAGTIHVGPALVLMLLGAIGALMVAFAMHPIASVATMWLFFFLTSQLAQSIGRSLGLDSDGDGDVDMLDILHFLSGTRVGNAIGLKKLYEFLNDATKDPFREIHKRLDLIQEEQMIANKTTNGKSK